MSYEMTGQRFMVDLKHYVGKQNHVVFHGTILAFVWKDREKPQNFLRIIEVVNI